MHKLIIGCVLGLAVTAQAASAFPDAIKTDSHLLPKVSEGELSRFMIKGCDVALFISPDINRDQVLSDMPRALELHYVRSFKAEQFAAAAWDTLKRALEPQALESVRARVETLHQAYRDIEKGDRYRLTYIPGQGTSLALNGRNLVVIPGYDFAAAYFGIWLGSDPISKRLQASLLSPLKARKK